MLVLLLMGILLLSIGVCADQDDRAFADEADTPGGGSSVLPEASPESDFDYKIGDTLYGYGAYIMGYKGTSKEVAIPGKIEGADVVYASLLDAGLETLDVSRCGALMFLGCSNNRLTALDVSNNTALVGLDCYGNRLIFLDVSNNVNLLGLSCGDNQLVSLTVGNNTALQYLYCPDNRLASLDVSGNTALERLSCFNNPLTFLDVRNNMALASLNCAGNRLASLDVSGNTALERLYCYDNYIADTTALEAWLAQENHYGLVLPQSSPVLSVLSDFGVWKGRGLANAEINTSFYGFVGLSLDGQVVAFSNYTVAAGGANGTVITLKEDYLKTLDTATHAFQASFTNGSADLTLVVDAQASTGRGNDSDDRKTVPSAGDNEAMRGAMIALPVSALGLLAALIWRNRRHPKRTAPNE